MAYLRKTLLLAFSLAGCNGSALRGERGVELQRVDVQSALPDPQRHPSANGDARLELRLAALEPTENWVRTEIATTALFLDKDPFLNSQDVHALSLRQQRWNDLPSGARRNLERLPASLIGSASDGPVYSVEMKLTTLGEKIYQDVQQKFPDRLLVLRDESRNVIMMGWIDGHSTEQRPVLYLTSQGGVAGANAALDKLKGALERSPDL